MSRPFLTPLADAPPVLAVNDLRQGGLPGAVSMAERVATQDWAATPLGSLNQWPAALRATVKGLLDVRQAAFVVWGAQWRLIYNDAFSGFLHDRHPQALGMRFQDACPDLWPSLQGLLERGLAGDVLCRENLPLNGRREGQSEPAWFSLACAPVFDDSGAVAGLYGVCTDTTPAVLLEHQHQAEREAERQHLQRIFEQAPGCHAVVSGPDHRVECANPAFARLAGERWALGRPLAEVWPEAAAQGQLAWLEDVRAAGATTTEHAINVQLNTPQAGGQAVPACIHFRAQTLTEASGEVTGILLQGHDTSQQQSLEDALRMFTDSIPAMAWTATPDGQLERINAQWTAYTGQPANQALGLGWVQALHPQDRELPWHAWCKSHHQSQPWQSEYRLRGRDGQHRWFLSRAVAQRDDQGRVTRWFGTTTDIEEAKRLQQALADADRQKDEFLATLAHELRNPLAPIRMAAHLLATPHLPLEMQRKTTEVIKRQVSHMARLLDDLLDIARVTKGQLQLKKESVYLHDIVATAVEAARPLMDAKHHQLSVHLPGSPAMLEADPVRLAQVLSNLLNNAAKYTDPGGRIALEVRCDGHDCHLDVSDNGIGLKPESLQTIFQMFSQEAAVVDRAEGGLGIGLALVKGLVELHGGQVEVRSAGLGHGSTFTVHLHQCLTAPLPEVTTQGLPIGNSPHRQRYKVLIADDNLDTAEGLATLMRLDGHQVFMAQGGEEALALAEQEKPDVMILDIGMPGLSGYELARRVRRQAWGHVPLLVAATGWGQQDDKYQATAAGFNAHLTKPFDPDELLKLVRGHVGHTASAADQDNAAGKP